MSTLWKIGVIFGYVLTVCTSVILGWQITVLYQQKQLTTNTLTNTATDTPSTPIPSTLPQNSNLNTEQVSLLQASISALTQRVEKLEGKKQTTPTTTFQPSKFTKQVLYLGSSTTTNREWTDSGVQIELNSADYPANAQVLFEAGLSCTGCESWARLKNKTTNELYTNTELSSGTSQTIWKSSTPIQLTNGKNSYVVEVRSSSGETAYISGARLVISK